MSETTHEPSGEDRPPGPPQTKMVVTRYPTAPEVLVLTAPNNIPMSFAQLLAMNGLTPEIIAGLQGGGAGGDAIEPAAAKKDEKKD